MTAGGRLEGLRAKEGTEMDIQKRPASPGIYVVWGAGVILLLVMLYGLGGVITDWPAPPAEPVPITAPPQ